MGIYDRDYYRREGPSYLESLIPSGRVCKWLIGINIACFLVQLVTLTPVNGDMVDGAFTDALILDTAKVADGQVWRLVTHAFLHNQFSFWHILFNMLFLWMFGSNLESRYGSREFLAFYLTAALVGGLAFEAQALITGEHLRGLGASGAVTAVLVLFAILYPNVPILLFFVLPVPVWVLAVFNVAQDAFHLFGRVPTNVGVAAHLGGAAFGFLYWWQSWTLTGWWQGVQKWRKERSRPRLRVYRPDEEPVAVAASASHSLDEHLDAKLDAVLEKLSRTGRDSLTDNEKDILLKASEIYKKKRT